VKLPDSETTIQEESELIDSSYPSFFSPYLQNSTSNHFFDQLCFLFGYLGTS